MRKEIFVTLMLLQAVSCISESSKGNTRDTPKTGSTNVGAIPRITPTLMKTSFRSTLPYDNKYIKEWSRKRPIRPANMFQLEASNDDALCLAVVSKMNEPGELEKDSLFTGKGWVEWSVIGGKPEPISSGSTKGGYIEQQSFYLHALQFARADFDGDGVDEFVYRENFSPSSIHTQEIFIFDTDLLSSSSAREEFNDWCARRYPGESVCSKQSKETDNARDYIGDFFDNPGQKVFSFRWRSGSVPIKAMFEEYGVISKYSLLFSIIEVNRRHGIVVSVESSYGAGVPSGIEHYAPRAFYLEPKRDGDAELKCAIAYGFKTEN